MHIIKSGNHRFNPTRPTIILDRDGVLNFDRENYVTQPAHVMPIPGAKAAVNILNSLHYNIFLATNQQCINKGIITEKQALDINQLILESTNCCPVEIHMCPHLIAEACPCRKPKPGMLYAILNRYNIDPATTLFVGDKLTDWQAAARAAIPFALVQTGDWPGDRHNYPCDMFMDLLNLSKHLKAKSYPLAADLDN